MACEGQGRDICLGQCGSEQPSRFVMALPYTCITPMVHKEKKRAQLLTCDSTLMEEKKTMKFRQWGK